MTSPAFTLDGKVIVVTGASTGIGRAAARVMAGQGARVLLVARRQALLDEAVAEIGAGGGTAHGIAADVSMRDGAVAAIDAAEALYGPIDGLFANAGISGPVAPIADYPDDDFDRVMAVTVKSLFWQMQRVLPAMVARRAGAIVATGSLASARGLPLTCGYNAAKHAVLGLVRSAAAEAAAAGVRVNCLLPGLIETPMLTGLAHEFAGGDAAGGMVQLARMVPQGRVGTPDEVANVAAFLLSDAAAYVNGQAWAVDGGILGTIYNEG